MRGYLKSPRFRLCSFYGARNFLFYKKFPFPMRPSVASRPPPMRRAGLRGQRATCCRLIVSSCNLFKKTLTRNNIYNPLDVIYFLSGLLTLINLLD